MRSIASNHETGSRAAASAALALLLASAGVGMRCAHAEDAPAAPAAPAASIASAASPWQVAGVQGLVQIVIVPKAFEGDADAYKAQVEKLCPGDRTCFVNFYTNSSGAEAALPLPDAIAAEATARFRRSTKNGAELFQWSCRLGKSASDAQCF